MYMCNCINIRQETSPAPCRKSFVKIQCSPSSPAEDTTTSLKAAVHLYMYVHVQVQLTPWKNAKRIGRSVSVRLP